MTVRLAVFSGSDWSDGEVLYAADLNDTLNLMAGYGIIRRKLYSEADETTDTAYQGSYADITPARSFTITGASGGLILGIHVTAEVSNSTGGADYATVSLVISGTNLGTLSIDGNLRAGDTSSGVQPTIIGGSEQYMFYSGANGYAPYATNCTYALPILDDTTTFTFRGQTGSTNKLRLKNIVVTVVYVRDFEDD